MHLLDSSFGHLFDDRDAVHSLDLVHHHSGLGHGHDALFVADLLHEVRLLYGFHFWVSLDHLNSGLELLRLQLNPSYTLSTRCDGSPSSSHHVLGLDQPCILYLSNSFDWHEAQLWQIMYWEFGGVVEVTYEISDIGVGRIRLALAGDHGAVLQASELLLGAAQHAAVVSHPVVVVGASVRHAAGIVNSVGWAAPASGSFGSVHRAAHGTLALHPSLVVADVSAFSDCSHVYPLFFRFRPIQPLRRYVQVLSNSTQQMCCHKMLTRTLQNIHQVIHNTISISHPTLRNMYTKFICNGSTSD